MKDIQITLGALETFSERIKILEDEIGELTKQRTLLQTQVATGKAKNGIQHGLAVCGFIIGAILFIMSIILASEGGAEEALGFFLFMAFVFIFIGFYLSFEKKTVDTNQFSQKVKKIDESIETKKLELNEYKQKKREVILENERKLSDSMEEKVTEAFSFDDIEDAKECPMCAEIVKAKAKICRYCGHEF